MGADRPGLLEVFAFLIAAIPLLGAQPSSSSREGSPEPRAHRESIRQHFTPANDVLRFFSSTQIETYLEGADPRGILAGDGGSLAEALAQQGVEVYEIPWYTIDGGGGLSNSNDYELVATVGQVDVGVSSGGDFDLTAGFWASRPDLPIFNDGFETGDTSRWSNSTP